MSRKRRKLDSPKNRPTPSQSRSDASGQSLSVDELAWKEITPSGRLDDAEGFLGLEEIDDVEIIRDPKGEQTRFRCKAPGKLPGSDAKSRTDQLSDEFQAVFQDDEEWSGFPDEKAVQHNRAEGNASRKTSGRILSKKTERRNGNNNGLQAGIPYGILDDGDPEPTVDVTGWSDLSLSNETLSAISNLGFSCPTPIQTAVIPQILAGHDVIGKAVTGSGKSLAFAIPIFEKWLATGSTDLDAKLRQSGFPISLILTPTRELAHQLTKHFEDLVQIAAISPRIVTVTGGLSIYKQQRKLVDADIIIATPGRLWEVMNGSQDLIDGLKRIKFLVIDEADRLLSEGHFKEVEEILDILGRRVFEDKEDGLSNQPDLEPILRQTLIFSATFHKGLQRKLASRSQFNDKELLTPKQSMDYLIEKITFRESRPKFVDVNPTSHMAERLQESLVECSAMEKDIHLYSILIQFPHAKSLVFTNSISSVRRLTPLLQNLNLPTSALHSSMPQKARLRSVERFSEPQSGGSILIATDVAARGLDIQNIDLIIHYHVPRTADMYIHRSGRTARAEHAGKSILLCSPEEVAGVTKLIAQVHSEASSSDHLETMPIDRNLVTRLRPRLALSQKITAATSAKEKIGSQDHWLRTAAEELGVDFDSDEFAAEGAKNSRGRGSGKREKQKVVGQVSKGEVAGWRTQLKDLLSKHVNLGVSERYLAGGAVNIDALLDAQGKTEFLSVREMGG